MEIGFVTDGLGFLPLEEMLATIVGLGVRKLELACGNWSSAPHVKLDELVQSPARREEYLGKVRAAGAENAALNCSGNQLAPGEDGQRHEAVVRQTFSLAARHHTSAGMAVEGSGLAGIGAKPCGGPRTTASSASP